MNKAATEFEIDDLKRQIINHENLSKQIKDIFLALVNNSCRLTRAVAFAAEEEIFPALLKGDTVCHCVIHERRCLTVECDRQKKQYLVYFQPDVKEKVIFNRNQAVVIDLEDIK